MKLFLLSILVLLGCGPAIPRIPGWSDAIDKIPKPEDHISELQALTSFWDETNQDITPFYPNNFELDEKWRPLKWVRENFDIGDMIITVKDTVYVRDINILLSLQNTTEGMDKLTGILLHEQQHAIRQEENPNWILQYCTDSNFRWEEEKIGWELQLKYWDAHNILYFPERIAYDLENSYGGFNLLGIEVVGKMVSYEEAIEWIYSLQRNE